jgi:hypothetical protein
MKVIAVSILFIFMVALPMLGQERRTIIVKAGTRVIDYFSFNEEYRYPEFIKGKVVFKNGSNTLAKLNYNILHGDMQFIQLNDTLAIANVKDISFVQIMQDTFYYDNGYLEVLAGKNPAIMSVKNYVKFSDRIKVGAYGSRSATSAIQTYSSINNPGDVDIYKLIPQEDLVFTRITNYYIGNSKDGFRLYRRNNVLKLIPQHKSEIEEYLKKKAVNFKIREDLLRLTKFIQEIR